MNKNGQYMYEKILSLISSKEDGYFLIKLLAPKIGRNLKY